MSEDNPTLPYPEASIVHETLVIPGEQGSSDAVPHSRRKRWPWVLFVIVLVLAALAVAAELLARAVVPGIVRGIVIEQLDLPANQQLDVDASGILLPQLIAGRFDSLHLSTDAVTIQGITGAVDVFATGVPVTGGEMDAAHGTIRIDADQFTALVAGSDLPIDEIAFDAPDVTVAGSVQVFTLSIPVTLTVTPGVAEGELQLTPQSISVGGVVLDADQVQATLGPIGANLTRTHTLCVADQLPAGLTVTGLEIQGENAVIDVDVDGAIVTDAGLQQLGVCSAH
ncbi:MAG: LmeA family phospholipid-binding protein [Microbacterium sp.]